jgi:flagellar basal-body rod protein FlgC
MDVSRALDVSASALSAQRTRMNVIAENLANTDSSVTATGRPYQRKLVLLESIGGQDFGAVLRGADGGVRVRAVVPSQEPPRRVYEPSHPQAGPDGFVELPNVNPLREMVDMLSTTRAYEANATAFQASKTLATKLLELLR